MAKWLVTFAQPVVYQQGHPEAEARVSELLVHAATPEGALVHAYRVVTGDVAGATVARFEGDDPPPLIEPLQDVHLVLHD